MADKGSQEELTLRRMPDGGYLVSSYGQRFDMAQMLFASADIDAALEYMKGQIEPVPQDQAPSSPASFLADKITRPENRQC